MKKVQRMIMQCEIMKSMCRNGSTVQTGNTGFRFVCIDLLTSHNTLHLGEVTTMFKYRVFLTADRSIVVMIVSIAGYYQGALNSIRTYWGGMLDMGSTTFWRTLMSNGWKMQNVLINWFPKEKDIHGDYGDHCYVGFRHSLCHGWASGPTAWG